MLDLEAKVVVDVVKFCALSKFDDIFVVAGQFTVNVKFKNELVTFHPFRESICANAE